MTFLIDFKKEFELTEKEARNYLKNAPKFYKKHTIKKRNGGKREIYQPTKSLKIIQRWIIKKYFNSISVHKCATAYIRHRNIVNNAEIHSKNSFLLKMDFKDFFYSITEDDLAIFFDEKFFFDGDIESRQDLINLLLCKVKGKEKLRLSIGAPSSPFISNVLLYNFDNEVYKLCEKLGIAYTRYADDLFFSTSEKNVLFKIINEVDEIISNLNYPANLEINSEKTVKTSKKFNRTITGLVISNDGTVNIGRNKKRKWRMKAYNLSKKIKNLTEDNFSEEIREEISSLKGYISFLSGIDRKFADDLKRISNLY